MNTTTVLIDEPKELFGIDLLNSPNKTWKLVEIEKDDFDTYYKFSSILKIYDKTEVAISAVVQEDLTGYISIDLPLDRDLIFEMFQELERKIFGNYITKQEAELKYKYILDGEYSNSPYECSIEADNIYLITYNKYLGKFDFTIYLYECNKKMIFDDGKVSFEDEYGEDSTNIDTYSIEEIWVNGFPYLSANEKDYIAQNVKVGDRVYFRNEFDNPVDKNAILVLHEGVKIGYVQAHKAELILSLFRSGKIDFVKIASIDNGDGYNILINIDVYYQDKYGFESLPYYPLSGRPISVVQTDLWTNQEDYLEDWHLCLFTDQLCYKFKSLFNSEVYKKEEVSIGLYFDMFISHYLDGTWTTKDSIDKVISFLESDCAKAALRKQIESYLENMDYTLQ